MNDVTEAIAKQLSVLDGNEPDSFTVEANVIDGDSSGPVTIKTHDPQWRDEHATWRTYIGRAEKLRQHLREQGYVIERGCDNNGWRVEAVFEQDATHDHKLLLPIDGALLMKIINHNAAEDVHELGDMEDPQRLTVQVVVKTKTVIEKSPEPNND